MTTEISVMYGSEKVKLCNLIVLHLQVLWEGKVVEQSNQEDWTKRTRELNDFVANDMSVDISMLSVGDGTTLVFKRWTWL